MKALLEQIGRPDLLTDPAGLYEVADAVTGSLTTDTGLDSLGELSGLGESLRGLSLGRGHDRDHAGASRPPGTATGWWRTSRRRASCGRP